MGQDGWETHEVKKKMTLVSKISENVRLKLICPVMNDKILCKQLHMCSRISEFSEMASVPNFLRINLKFNVVRKKDQ